MQHLMTLRLTVAVLSALMVFAIVGVSWVRMEQAVHTKKAGHSAKHSEASKHSEARHKTS